MVNIAVLVSGGGTNLQALIDAQNAGRIPNGRIAAVISSKGKAFALERASAAGIPSYVIKASDYADRRGFSQAYFELVSSLDIGLIVFAGFLRVLDAQFCADFKGGMINVHPALIPSFCGNGFYGLHVHERALEYGVKLSGASVHFVTPETDGGPIILQQAIDVLDDDTPESLQQRIMTECEQPLLTRAVTLYCDGRLRLEGRRVRILNKE